MTQRKERWNGPSLTVSKRVKDLRTRKGWSAEKLANACADAGMPELNRSVIANIENRRRKTVTLEEALTLAFVLDVAPVHLIVPLEADDGYDAERYLVTPDRTALLVEARAWIKGDAPLSSQDPRTYFSEVPKEDFRPSRPTEDQINLSSENVRFYRDMTAKFGFTDLTEGPGDGEHQEEA